MKLAHGLERGTIALRASVAGWDAKGQPRRELTLQALYVQRIYRLLSREPSLAERTIARLPPPLRAEARDNVTARRNLRALATPLPLSRIRIAPPAPALQLERFYKEAQRRFGIRWQLLAAVNFVESAFGKVRSASSAGALGPMQFLPSTWRAYGMGGNVHDPRDAIMGAANYLRRSGAPRDERRALYAYNHSQLYVDAVLRYARRIERDRRALLAYYNWQVFVLTPQGERRVTGPR